MKLLVVIPFCKKDQSSAIRLLEWIIELGGCKENRCVLIADIECTKADISSVADVAQKAFYSVSHFTTPFKLPNEAHPVGPNWMFETAFKNVNHPFLWLEPDAVPTRKDWLKEIEFEYESMGQALNGKTILADVAVLDDPKFPKQIPSGVAVYPGNAITIYGRLQLNRRIAWDIRFADAVMPLVQKSSTIQNIVNHANPPDVKASQLKPKCALFHPSKNGAMIDQLRKGGQNPALSFYHSGDLGDIIYSLPAVRNIGSGDFLIGPDNRFRMDTRETMTPERARAIIPLLESQAYIKLCKFSDRVPASVNHDLNKVRGIMGGADPIDLRKDFNLARVYLHYYKFDLNLDVPAWLEVTANPVERVIINRTMRYRNKDFSWDLILRKYRGSIGFIGTKHEHEDFMINWGPVRHIVTKNLLEAAQVIAGAELFVGNQSSCYAIAEGLKQQSILETYPTILNTIFKREPEAKKVWHGCDTKTVLPDVLCNHAIPKTKTKSFTLVGHVNWFTALGRELCKLSKYATDHGWNVCVYPISVDERIPIPKKVMDSFEMNPPNDGPRILISPLLDVPKYIRPNDIVLTMWESTRIPQGVAQSINANASLLITPSTWCANTFSSCGVDVPIEVVPLGVDFDVFKPFKRNRRNTPYCFGTAGRLAHGGTRKGIEDVIEAFGMAFPLGTEKVRLSMKLFEDCYIPSFSDKRITYIARTLSDEEMVEWYKTIDCFVSMSKGEGWGNHVHEALSMHIPVIAPSYGGLAEMIMKHESIPYEIVPASEGYMGHWCKPSISHACNKMISAASDSGIGESCMIYPISRYAEPILNLISE